MKKNWTRSIALALSAVMLTGLLVSCGGEETAESKNPDSNPTQTQTDGKVVLRVGINSALNQLSPFVAAGNALNQIKNGVWETLAAYDKNRNYAPQIAKEWTQADEEGVVWDVEIFDYVYDSEGNHITADDVVYDYETFKATGASPQLSHMISIEKTGDYTVRFTIDAPTMGNIESILRSTPIIAKAAYEASPDEMATATVGTGPYAITNFVGGSSVTLTKRDNYWQTDESKVAWLSRANVDEITYVTITEGSQMAIALETGEIDIAHQIPQSSGARFIDDERFDFFDVAARLGFQMYPSGDSHSPLATSKELRQAVCYAIDVKGIIDGVFRGYGEQQYTFGPTSVPDFQEKWKNEDYYSYNPEKAKELLAQAGYKEGELTLVFLCTSDDQWSKTAQIIQGYLMAVGINVEIHAYEGALYGSQFLDGQYYDLVLNNTTHDFIVGTWNTKLSQVNYGGKTCSSVVDDKLEELIQGCIYPDNHTPENVDACHQYIKDQAYAYGLAGQVNFNFIRSDLNVDPDSVWFDGLSFMFIPGLKFAK